MATATFPLDTIAKLLDITPRRVNQLASEGIIPKADRGRYELVPVVRAYVKYLRDKSVNADVGVDSFSHQRARLTKIRADLAEMEKDQLAQKLIPAEDVEDAWSAVITNFRAKMIAIPTKASAVAFGAESVSEVKEILKDHIYEALEELSQVEVQVNHPISSSELSDGDIQNIEDDSTTTEPNS